MDYDDDDDWHEESLISSLKGFYQDVIAPHRMEAMIVFTALMIGVLSFFCMPPDNPVEQIAEKIIEQETGISLDLSP